MFAFAKTRNSLCAPPGSTSGNVWLAYVPAAVPVIVWLETSVPPPAALIASRQSSTVPDAAPFVPPVTRNVSALMLVRLKGPFSSIQSPALRLPRWRPAADVGRRERRSSRTG